MATRDESNTILEVSRANFRDTRLVEEPLEELAPGAVRLRVDRIAITANTITYAVMGDALGYWQFYPAGAGWGRVPAMGWADVVGSNDPHIRAGGRYYGWFPMSQYVDVHGTATEDGLRDDGAHRREHATAYRTFVQTTRDPMYSASADGEDRHALLRGLFATGYLADQFFLDEDYFGADDVLVLSASSKTAIAFAQCATGQGRRLVGITSPANLEFVRRVGLYDTVTTYDDLESLTDASGDADGRTAVLVDMAGNRVVRSKVHSLLAERLKYSMAIGLSHHEAPSAQVTAGPEPTMFFAPAEMARRAEQWRRDEYHRRLGDALEEFVATSSAWLRVEHEYGGAAAQRTWGDVLGARVAPDVGKVVSLHVAATDRAAEGVPLSCRESS